MLCQTTRLWWTGALCEWGGGEARGMAEGMWYAGIERGDGKANFAFIRAETLGRSVRKAFRRMHERLMEHMNSFADKLEAEGMRTLETLRRKLWYWSAASYTVL